MKTLKALIIEDQIGIARAITKCILDVAMMLNIKIDFIYAVEYEDAREKIMATDYDLISLDGILGNRPSLNLISTILNLHPKAITFFLSSSQELIIRAKEQRMKQAFLKGDEKIINHDDLMTIKKLFIEKGFINYEVLYQELFSPQLIFSEPKEDLELFKDAEQRYLQVIKILTANEINFAIVDRQAQTKIFVDGASVKLVKNLAKNSHLDFWLKWSNKFHH